MAELVVALDVPDLASARSLITSLTPLGVTFKIGYEAFYGYGPELTHEFETAGAPYALDLKLHDIPRTVAAGVRALVRPGVRVITLHAIGGNEMMVAAVETAAERANELGVPPPELMAVTVLTSIGATELGELGLSGGTGENVIRLAALARDARCDGVVCSPQEAADIKRFFGSEFKAFCPGVRPTGSAQGDQKRTMTPRDAAASGADYLVVGRPVTEAADPVAAVRAILDELAAPV